MEGIDGPAPALDDVHTMDDLGHALRALRRRHARRQGSAELTVREIARRSGFANGVVSEYLNGKALPPIDRFDVLMRLFGATAPEQRALATARDRVEEGRRARHAGPVPRELPPEVSAFTGRTHEIAALDHMLAGGPSSASPRAVVLTGTAGVGKTALAVHWAHRHAADRPDGCLYVDLRGYGPEAPFPPTEALAGFLRSLGVAGPDVPPTEERRVARFRTLVADRRMLVLLDNARDTDQVRSLLPAGPGCVTIVTSRDALTGLVARHGARRLGIDPLPLDDAVRLLSELVGGRVGREPDAAAALAERCARLPLTLRLVAELVDARPGVTLADIDSELVDTHERLGRLDAGGDRHSATRAVFSWSYEGLAPAIARAFRLLGASPGADVDAYAFAALLDTDVPAATALLRDLARAHLARAHLGRAHPGRPGGSARYDMHDLLRAYAVELADADPPAETDAALTRLRRYQLSACARAMDVIAPFDTSRPTVDDPGFAVPPFADAGAATAWLDTELPNIVAAVVEPNRAEAGRDLDDHAGRISRTLLRYLDVGAHYGEAEALFRAVGTGSPTRASALASLSIVAWRRGRTDEAIGHGEEALALATAAGDRDTVARALIGLGIAYWHAGRTADTIAVGERALALYRAAGDILGEARALGNLGTVRGYLGDHTHAAIHHRQSLDLFRKAQDPAGTANELSGLGTTVALLGRLDEAEALLREALTVAKRCGYRECEIVAMSELGSVRRRRGRPVEAAELQERALAAARRSGSRTTEAYVLGDLGLTYAVLGRLTDTLDRHRRALAIEAGIDDDHLAAELLNEAGEALLVGDRPGDAIRRFAAAIERTENGGGRFQRAVAHYGLARAHTALGDHATAEPHWSTALSMYEEFGLPQADQIRADRIRADQMRNDQTPADRIRAARAD